MNAASVLWLFKSFNHGESCQVHKGKKRFKDFSGKESTEGKAKTVCKKALKTPGKQAMNLLSV